MDGGSELSRECRELLANDFDVDALEYPNESLSIDELAGWVLDRTPHPRPVLIAESFSGSIAIEVLRRAPGRFAAAVLAFSFVLPPRSAAWRPFVRSPVFARPPPRWAIRRWMVGADAPESSISAVHDAIARVPGSVMANRVRAALATDARSTLAQLVVPLLSIRASSDWLVDPRSAPEAHAELPSLTIEGPHLGLHARPEESAAAIREWLRSLG